MYIKRRIYNISTGQHQPSLGLLNGNVYYKVFAVESNSRKLYDSEPLKEREKGGRQEKKKESKKSE